MNYEGPVFLLQLGTKYHQNHADIRMIPSQSQLQSATDTRRELFRPSLREGSVLVSWFHDMLSGDRRMEMDRDSWIAKLLCHHRFVHRCFIQF